MADDQLQKSGIYFDEYLQIRVWDPIAASDCKKFHTECQNFGEISRGFQNIASNFLTEVNKLTDCVENEKLRALGLKVSLQTILAKRKEQKYQLNMSIAEKRMELEKLKAELAALENLGEK